MAKRVLLVDDDSDIRNVYSEVLKNEGFEVVEAADGKTCLNCLISSNIDIVVLDIMIPIVNGFDVLQKIRQNPKTEKLPVIIITNLADEMGMANKLGATAFLIKSEINPNQLISKVKNILENKN